MVNSSARIRHFFQKWPNAAIFVAKLAQLAGFNKRLFYYTAAVL